MQTQVKEKPILFSGEMVRAILDGRKTQTRRVVKDQPHENGVAVTQDKHSPSIWHLHAQGGSPIDGHIAELKCPYEPGMRLWVREATFRDGDELYYLADGNCCQQIPECACCEVGKPKVKPSIFMPREASRITLEVTDVRCERLQSISEEDAKAEGVDGECIVDQHFPGDLIPWLYLPHFIQLWDSINAKRGYSWESDPLVWCISFKRLENSNAIQS